MQQKQITLEQVMEVHEAFRPLLLSQILRRTLNQITRHKKDRDDAQKKRLMLALQILKTKNVDLPAYPDKTHQSLKAQMKKQLDKISKKKDKKDKKSKSESKSNK
eukprot:UN02640